MGQRKRTEVRCSRCKHFLGWDEEVRFIVTERDKTTEVQIVVSHYKFRCPVAGCYAKHKWSPAQ